MPKQKNQPSAPPKYVARPIDGPQDVLETAVRIEGDTVVVELADRNVAEGLARRAAFRAAAQRMAWPITAAIGTTLAVFAPMLFWPGMVGEFMVYRPATVIVTLLASLLMALIFIPTLGSVIGHRSSVIGHRSGACQP